MAGELKFSLHFPQKTQQNQKYDVRRNKNETENTTEKKALCLNQIV